MIDYTKIDREIEKRKKESAKKPDIDINKEYTCNGKRVIGLQIVLKNSCGDMVTYPVKGSVVLREKPLKMGYSIWSIKGEKDVVWPKIEQDLIEVRKKKE